MDKGKKKTRLKVQMIAAILSNAYLIGFAKGKIYNGKLKQLCVPGLNCYSCPGAVGSCPIGSLQAVLGSRDFMFSFYIVGFLMVVGSVMGRFVCGWLCPFGLIQDLLHKIPFPKKIKIVYGDKWLKNIKYFILAVFVILLPLYAVDFIGQGSPWFCTYICPSGTLEGGIPLVLAHKSLQESVGFLYVWKNFLLVLTIVLSIIIYRPFCRYICPLGAIYGIFNPIAFYRYKINERACTRCNVCQKNCKLNIAVYENPNSMDCIRCGDCKRACPHNAIK